MFGDRWIVGLGLVLASSACNGTEKDGGEDTLLVSFEQWWGGVVAFESGGLWEGEGALTMWTEVEDSVLTGQIEWVRGEMSFSGMSIPEEGGLGISGTLSWTNETGPGGEEPCFGGEIEASMEPDIRVQVQGCQGYDRLDVQMDEEDDMIWFLVGELDPLFQLGESL